MHFLASVEAGQAWCRERPQALLLTVAQGFALGQAVNRLRLGGALAQPPLAEPPRMP